MNLSIPLTPDQTRWLISAGLFLSGLLFGILITWLWSRAARGRQTADLEIRIARLTTERDGLTAKIDRLEPALEDRQEEIEALRIERAGIQAARTADAEKLQWAETARDQMRDAFEVLAHRILKSNSEAFLNRAGENTRSLLNQFKGDWNLQKAEIRQLVDPVKENLTVLDSHLRELEQKREGAYEGLRTQLNQLSRTQAELQTATVTLTQALKSSTIRGRWGEIQLRRVVEMAGMVKHVDFSEQVQGGDTGRPDMVVHLPHGGKLPVDSKAPLEAYLEAAGSEDEGFRSRRLADHAKALQGRVRELSQKKYWSQFEEAPDFVVMFIPNEACLSAAFEKDPGILEYAVDQRVLVTTPVTLIALLRSVAWGWQQHRMTENARRIAEEGKELFRRMETFIGHLGDLGIHLNRTLDGFNRSVGSLERRLVPAMRRFQEMGIGEDPDEKLPNPIHTRARMPMNPKEFMEADGEDD
ncbi:MAG: DNA recombination protein RmuC [Thermodesulfobacteriota bacterium]